MSIEKLKYLRLRSNKPRAITFAHVTSHGLIESLYLMKTPLE